MLKRTLTLIFLLVLVQAVAGQNRNCATMEVHERQLNENPDLRARFDSVQTVLNQQSQTSPQGSTPKAHTYPALPGFVPSGDPAEDARNFAAAKKALYASDPELYLKLTSKTSPSNQTKTAHK